MTSIKNTVIVAIMQSGVIVAGVLAAGICHKVWSTRDMIMPLPVAMVYSYGFMGFIVPLVWGVSAVTLQLRSNVSDDIKVLAFWFGVFALILFAGFIVYADVTPWFNIPWSSGGDAEN